MPYTWVTKSGVWVGSDVPEIPDDWTSTIPGQLIWSWSHTGKRIVKAHRDLIGEKWRGILDRVIQ